MILICRLEKLVVYIHAIQSLYTCAQYKAYLAVCDEKQLIGSVWKIGELLLFPTRLCSHTISLCMSSGSQNGIV